MLRQKLLRITLFSLCQCLQCRATSLGNRMIGKKVTVLDCLQSAVYIHVFHLQPKHVQAMEHTRTRLSALNSLGDLAATDGSVGAMCLAALLCLRLFKILSVDSGSPCLLGSCLACLGRVSNAIPGNTHGESPLPGQMALAYAFSSKGVHSCCPSAPESANSFQSMLYRTQQGQARPRSSREMRLCWIGFVQH